MRTMFLNRRRVLPALTTVVIAALVAMAGAAPAMAADLDGEDHAMAALADMGLLDPDRTVTGELTPNGGVAVGAGRQAVELRPDTDLSGAPTVDGSAIVYDDPRDAFAYAVTGEGTAANAGYAVIRGADAPDEYRFRLSSDGRPAILESAEDGTVLVKDAAGAVINALHAPWAIDASGRALPSSYSVAGDVVIQHVEHAGADYPVVADPRLACDVLWCTLELTRTETTIVAQGGGAAIGCSLLGPAAPICAALLVGSSAMANIALANKKRIDVRSARALIPTSTHMVYIGCCA